MKLAAALCLASLSAFAQGFQALPNYYYPAWGNAGECLHTVSNTPGNGGYWIWGACPGTLPPATPSAPSRSLNSNFTPDAAHNVLATYSVNISCALTLSGGQSSTVELRSDTSATPSTARATVANTNSGSLVVGVAITNAQTATLTYLIPAGHAVRLASSGTCAVSLVGSSEVAL